MDWKKYEDKLLHVVVESVYPYGPEEDEITLKVVEPDERVRLRVDTEEN